MPRGRTGEELVRGPNAASGKGASPGSKTRGRGKREAPGNRGSGRPQPQGRGRGAPTARPLLSETPAADEPDAGPAGHAGTPGWTLPATPRRSWSLSCSAEGPRGQARGRSLSETRPLAPPAGSGLRVPGRGEARAQRAVGGRRQTPRPRLRQETQARGAPRLLLADCWLGGEGAGEDRRLAGALGSSSLAEPPPPGPHSTRGPGFSCQGLEGATPGCDSRRSTPSIPQAGC